MVNAANTVVRFFEDTLWREDHSRAGLPRRFAFRVLQAAVLVVQRFRRNKGFLRSTALSFTTLLAVVPLLAFAFSVLKGLGAERQIRQYLFETPAVVASGGVPGPLSGAAPVPAGEGAVVEPVPAAPAATPVLAAAPAASAVPARLNLLYRITGGRPEVALRLMNYIENTDFTALGVFGLATLLWTIVTVLGTIEATFNDIWGATRGRTLLRRFADYTAVMVIAPVLLVTAVGATAYFLQNPLGDSGVAGTLWRTAVRMAGWVGLPVITWGSFAVFYSFMPNARVSLRSALVGGVAGGTLWQLAFWAYTTFNIGVAKYNAIYTSFAALPIFMMWLYFSWVIVIIGAEVACAFDNLDSFLLERRQVNLSAEARELAALRLYLEVASAFRSGGPAPTIASLSDSAGVPERSVREITAVLEAAGLLVRVENGARPVLKPARDIARVTAADVVRAMRRAGDSLAHGDDPLWGRAGEIHSGLGRALEDAQLPRAVSDLLDRDGDTLSRREIAG